MTWVNAINQMVSGSIALTSSGVNAVRAERERKRQQKKLDQLNKTARPRYEVTPELRGYYNQATSDVMNPAGFSGAEISDFNQRLGQNYNTQYNAAVNRAGGQTGQFVNNVLSANNLGAINNFAVAEAQLRRQNKNDAFGRQAYGVGQYQNIDNMNTQADLNYRLMLEQALGQSIAQQKQNISNAISSAGQTGAMGAGYATGSGGGSVPYQNNSTTQPPNPNSNFTVKSSGYGSSPEYSGAPAGNPWGRWDGSDPAVYDTVYYPNQKRGRGGMGAVQFDEYGNPIN